MIVVGIVELVIVYASLCLAYTLVEDTLWPDERASVDMCQNFVDSSV